MGVDDDVISELLSIGKIDPPQGIESLTVSGRGPIYPNRYRVDEIAAVALGITGLAAANIWELRGGEPQAVSIDIRSAAAAISSIAFDRIDGKRVPRNRDRPGDFAEPSTTGFYECRAGEWIFLHGNLPHLHAGALDLLDCAAVGGAIQQIQRPGMKMRRISVQENPFSRPPLVESRGAGNREVAGPYHGSGEPADRRCGRTLSTESPPQRNGCRSTPPGALRPSAPIYSQRLIR